VREIATWFEPNPSEDANGLLSANVGVDPIPHPSLEILPGTNTVLDPQGQRFIEPLALDRPIEDRAAVHAVT
jgi:hypothetical protein